MASAGAVKLMVAPLRCHRCAVLGRDVIAHTTLHDKRGCQHFCDEHMRWRLTTSRMIGHSIDCAFALPAVPALQNGLPRVTYDPQDQCITALLTDSEPIRLFVMGADSGLTVEAMPTAALPSGARCLDVKVRRVGGAPVLVVNPR